MPQTQISGAFRTPKVGIIVDLGNPFLNLTLDGFLKIGSVAVAKVAAEETYHIVKRGSISTDNLQHSLKKMCKEGAYWGTVAGLCVGMEYGTEEDFWCERLEEYHDQWSIDRGYDLSCLQQKRRQDCDRCHYRWCCGNCCPVSQL